MKNIKIFIDESGTLPDPKDSRFYKMIKKKIISELRLNWPEAKRKLFR